MDQPVVSIIIPVFNRHNYIVECLQSCRAQVYRPVEVIVVDDGSTDTTAHAVQEFIEKFENESDISFRYLFQKNSGAPAARNLGLTVALGKFIQFMDSDDLFTPNGIVERMDAFFDCDVVFGDYATINRDSQPLLDFNFSGYSQQEAISFVAGKSILTGCLLFKKECLEAIKFDPAVEVLQDRELCIRLLIDGFIFKYVQKFAYYHRLPGDDNISSVSWVDKNPFRYIQTNKKILSNILKLDPLTIKKSVKAISSDVWKRGRILLQYGKRSEANFYFKYAIEINNGSIPKGALMRVGARITGYRFIEEVYSFIKKLKRRKQPLA